jgi:predicted membrane protein
MIIFTILGIITAVFFFIISLMAILEAGVKRRQREKFSWNMEQIDKRDKVVTRTGGLENDRLNERQ